VPIVGLLESFPHSNVIEEALAPRLHLHAGQTSAVLNDHWVSLGSSSGASTMKTRKRIAKTIVKRIRWSLLNLSDLVIAIEIAHAYSE
jgi:hypothetical protein